MAITTTNHTTTVATGEPTILGRLIASARSYLLRRRRVNETIAELDAMTDRDLADIGISRGDIRRVAEEAV
ncbi:MAG: DUF1127 domain-containing protein [Neomegalonema sp.]|nr:DUF1127 domain-containing protein [Neomegalonema sp.]